MQLRDYQREAVDRAISHMRESLMPACLDLSGGAGKSLIIAHIAKWVFETTGKKTLVLQPAVELVKQNFAKYATTGHKASIFSASANSKCMRHPVVFATPASVKSSLSRFGDAFGVVLIDECDQITETVRLIIDFIRDKNPNLRVIGVTGTPYRLNTGYIYRYDVDGSYVPDDQCIEPYFNKLLYRVPTKLLIDRGYLVPAHADPEHAAGYDALGLQVNRQGKYNAKEVERVFQGRGRLTSQIVADIVTHSRDRNAVMIFAATVEHAKEIMESLDPENSRMLGGDVNMRKAVRERLIADFMARKFKYLVNVATLCVGFDAPHVDVIAVLRATESARLFQQIIWRGVRLIDNSVAGDHAAIADSEKPDCLVLDYAQNVERFNLQGDLFNPEIKARARKEDGQPLNVKCPDCGFINEFGARPNPDEFEHSDDGYFLDLAGNPIETEHGPMPSHHGRRCNGQVASATQRGIFERCTQRWTSKECLECQTDNDIAARKCRECRAELVDPNEKLAAEFTKMKRDPWVSSTDEVRSFTAIHSLSQHGKDLIKCTFVTDYRTFSIWVSPSQYPKAHEKWELLNRAVFRGHIAPDPETFMQYLHKGEHPKTVTYVRQKGSDKFYNVFAYNRPADRVPEHEPQKNTA